MRPDPGSIVRTDVVTLGYFADPRPTTPRDDSADLAVDPLDALATLPSGDLVVLAWLPGVVGGGRALATARALLGRRDLAVVPLGASQRHPLTAAVAVAAVARRAPVDLPVAALPALVAVAADALASWRVVGSVAGATEPAPSLVQHALSWLPGTRFTVDLARDTTRTGGPVSPATGPRTPSGPAASAAGADLPAWAASRGGGAPWAHELLVAAGVRALDVSACGPLEAAPTGRTPRRASRRAELSVLTLPLRQLLLDPRLHDLHPCRGCERPAPAGTCRFCGHHRTAAPHPQEAHA